MSIPVDVTFRGLDSSPAVHESVNGHVEKLGQFGADLLRCHVSIERPGHRVRGNPYHVTIYLTVSGEDIVVSHEPQVESTLRQTGAIRRSKSTEIAGAAQDVQVALNEAFRRARRRLEDHRRRQRGQVKVHETSPRGQILRIVEGADYGFIQGEDGTEVYFHRNSLLNVDFEALAPGTPVAYVVEQGNEGPQASGVRVLG